ncbi:MAG: hypothetical protein ALECFALPRED_000801, partial [Alectoria fallacina]
NATSDANTAIMKTRIKYSTHITITSASAAKSITFHQSDLSALTHVENISSKTSITPSTTPPPTYRAISPSPPTYESYKKPYLTVADLYMRYAPLSRPPSTTTRTITVLPTMSMQDLYEKFHDKEKRVIPTSSKTLDSPIKQHSTRQNLEHVVFERFGFIRCPKNASKLRFSISSKSIIQRLIVQQQRHIKSIKHNALSDICIDDVRRHTMLPINLVTPSRRLRDIIPTEKNMNTSAEHIRCSNKV